MTPAGGWLLDTDVVSELRKAARCDANVRRWSESLPPELCHISVVTLAEIRRGIEAVTDPVFRAELEHWLRHGVEAWFGPRIMGVDEPVLRVWIDLMADAKTRRRSLGQHDALIAATAIRHGCTVATRNISDFSHTGVPVFDPWQA